MYKINRLSIYLVLLAALLIHTTILRHVRIFGSVPDLELICVIFFGLFLGENAGLEAGVFTGLLKDVFSLDFFGINTFIFALIGLLSGVISTKIFKESKITQAVTVLFFTLISMAMHFWIAASFSRSVILNFSEYFTCSIVPGAIYTSLVSIPALSRLIDMYGLRDSEEYI